MATSEFWRDLAEQFRNLPEGWTVYAEWDYKISPEKKDCWKFFGTSHNQFTFETLARRGASHLESCTHADLLISWLEAIRTEEGHVASSGSLKRLYELSLNYCKILESRALQAEFEDNKRNDPKNWSPLHRQVASLKGIRELITGPHLYIPESLVREALARQYGVKPEEVTWKQIQFEVAALLPFYPALTVVPIEEPCESTITPESSSETLKDAVPVDEVERRKKLLAEYKEATKASNKKIYEAKNSGIHKPQFYAWLNGNLSVKSTTAQNFERFLREKKPAIPRRQRD